MWCLTPDYEYNFKIFDNNLEVYGCVPILRYIMKIIRLPFKNKLVERKNQNIPDS